MKFVIDQYLDDKQKKHTKSQNITSSKSAINLLLRRYAQNLKVRQVQTMFLYPLNFSTN